MNKNVLIALVVVILVIGGVVLVKKNSNQAPANTNVNTPSTAPSAMKQSPSGEPEVSSQKEDTVSLTSNGFEPQTITVKAGDKVVWTNKSGEVATVNSNPHPAHTDYPPLNLGSFQDGGKLELVFGKKGTYKYHNHLNASEQGVVVVE